MLLAVQFIIPKPYGLAGLRGVVGYISVCACARVWVSQGKSGV